MVSSELSQVPGVGAGTAASLGELGIRSIGELAEVDPFILGAIGIGEEKAKKIIKEAAKLQMKRGYDALKDYKGEKYRGMKVGRGHKWNYDKGEWKEKKITPDTWEIHYEVRKRRVGKAPEGSGVPVGTKYNWLILAHQVVEKKNANVYTTVMDGMKFKVAHASADKKTWNLSEQAQRKRVVKILREMADEIEAVQL